MADKNREDGRRPSKDGGGDKRGSKRSASTANLSPEAKDVKKAREDSPIDEDDQPQHRLEPSAATDADVTPARTVAALPRHGLETTGFPNRRLWRPVRPKTPQQRRWTDGPLPSSSTASTSNTASPQRPFRNSGDAALAEAHNAHLGHGHGDSPGDATLEGAEILRTLRTGTTSITSSPLTAQYETSTAFVPTPSRAGSGVEPVPSGSHVFGGVGDDTLAGAENLLGFANGTLSTTAPAPSAVGAQELSCSTPRRGAPALSPLPSSPDLLRGDMTLAGAADLTGFATGATSTSLARASAIPSLRDSRSPGDNTFTSAQICAGLNGAQAAPSSTAASAVPQGNGFLQGDGESGLRELETPTAPRVQPFAASPSPASSDLQYGENTLAGAQILAGLNRADSHTTLAAAPRSTPSSPAQGGDGTMTGAENLLGFERAPHPLAPAAQLFASTLASTEMPTDAGSLLDSSMLQWYYTAEHRTLAHHQAGDDTLDQMARDLASFLNCGDLLSTAPASTEAPAQATSAASTPPRDPSHANGGAALSALSRVARSTVLRDMHTPRAGPSPLRQELFISPDSSSERITEKEDVEDNGADTEDSVDNSHPARHTVMQFTLRRAATPPEGPPPSDPTPAPPATPIGAISESSVTELFSPLQPAPLLPGIVLTKASPEPAPADAEEPDWHIDDIDGILGVTLAQLAEQHIAATADSQRRVSATSEHTFPGKDKGKGRVVQRGPTAHEASGSGAPPGGWGDLTEEEQMTLEDAEATERAAATSSDSPEPIPRIVPARAASLARASASEHGPFDPPIIASLVVSAGSVAPSASAASSSSSISAARASSAYPAAGGGDQDAALTTAAIAPALVEQPPPAPSTASTFTSQGAAFIPSTIPVSTAATSGQSSAAPKRKRSEGDGADGDHARPIAAAEEGRPYSRRPKRIRLTEAERLACEAQRLVGDSAEALPPRRRRAPPPAKATVRPRRTGTRKAAPVVAAGTAQPAVDASSTSAYAKTADDAMRRAAVSESADVERTSPAIEAISRRSIRLRRTTKLNSDQENTSTAPARTRSSASKPARKSVKAEPKAKAKASKRRGTGLTNGAAISASASSATITLAAAPNVSITGAQPAGCVAGPTPGPQPQPEGRTYNLRARKAPR